MASVVTIIGQLLLSHYRKRSDIEQAEAISLADAVSPAVEAVDDIIARMFDIIIRKRDVNFEDFTFPEKNSQETFSNPSSEITTIYRFVRYFSSAVHLQKKLPERGNAQKVRRAEFYCENKIRMALKGNLTEATYRIPTEAQNFIGAKFLDLTASKRPDDLDFYTFVTNMEKDEEARWAAEIVRRFLIFNVDYTKMDSQQVAVAIVIIYMIDLYQDILDRSKWEEFRVFLVSFVRAWNNVNAGRDIFLYRPRDLSGDDYLDTFALTSVSRESIKRRNKRIRKRQTRGRIIGGSGLRSQRGSVEHEFEFQKSPGDNLHVFNAFL